VTWVKELAPLEPVQSRAVVTLPLLLLGLASAPAGGSSTSRADRTVVIVRGGHFAGSGIVWDLATHRVLTALHVVEDMPPDGIEVVGPGGASLQARVIDRDPFLDLALLEVAGALEEGPPLGSGAALAPGDVIALVGCPEARCGHHSGRVLTPARQFAGTSYLAVAAEALPGSSGGAVLDARGEVVGIVDLTLADEPGVALAVPIQRAMERFQRSAGRPLLAQVLSPR
jgi:S1-C subfamily serine protease